MSLILETSLPWYQQLCINIIKSGQIPKHLAFMMDGNRHYATKTKQKNHHDRSGLYIKLAETLQWCKELGITEVTAYHASKENTKRSKEEVAAFVEITSKIYGRLLNEKDKIMKIGLCIRVIGDIPYLPPELQKIFAKLILLTENNTKFFFNIAFAYSGREEITNSIKCIVNGVNTGQLGVNDINVQLISNCLQTNKSPDPDLLIRTSGVTRLSDFLLWQISCTQVCFSNAFWPEFSIWQLLSAILNYQTNFKHLDSVKETKKEIYSNYISTRNNLEVDKFLKCVEQHRRKLLEDYINE